jgi:hypothetical protein
MPEFDPGRGQFVIEKSLYYVFVPIVKPFYNKCKNFTFRLKLELFIKLLKAFPKKPIVFGYLNPHGFHLV